jgi:hypothetical protein
VTHVGKWRLFDAYSGVHCSIIRMVLALVFCKITSLFFHLIFPLLRVPVYSSLSFFSWPYFSFSLISLFPSLFCQCCRSGSGRIGIILADPYTFQLNVKLNNRHFFRRFHFTVQNIENYDFCVTLTCKINQCLLTLLWIKSKKNSTYMYGTVM